MADHFENSWLWAIIFVILMAIAFRITPPAVRFVGSVIRGSDTERVRSKIEDHLYDKYGKEFVVDRIGPRSSRGDKFYQARIYPKSIVGTNKERDDYYYASARVNTKSFGRLGGVGDSYGLTKINIGAEEYLFPEAKEIFGERVKLKPEVKYRIENDLGFFEWNREPDFLKALQELKEHPEERRIELDLDVYIFDRIEDEEEKEERREDIFEFVQYLKDEGLFEYLEMRVVFVDERVLAPSYDEFEREVRRSDKVEVEIEEEDTTVELPPEELREEMSEELQEEIGEMSEEELLESMRDIRKDELNYDDLRKWNSQYQVLVYSKNMLDERYTSAYEDEYTDNPELIKKYNEIGDIKMRENFEYVY